MIDVTPRERPDEEFSASERAHLTMQVHGLLNALREMEAFADRLNAAQFHGAIRDAVLACGFADELEAWQGIMLHIRSGPCHEPSCRDRQPRA